MGGSRNTGRVVSRAAGVAVLVFILDLTACSSPTGSRDAAGAGGTVNSDSGTIGSSGGMTSASGGTTAAGGTTGSSGGVTSTGGTTTSTGGTAIGGATTATGGRGGATTGTIAATGGATRATGGTVFATGGAAGTARTIGTGGAGTGGMGAGGAATGGAGTGGGVSFQAAPKPRVLVLTDISNEPDDEESLVRFLVYANEYDVEGLVATTSTWLPSGPREDLIRAQLDAYEKVRPNLALHAAGYPTADALRAVTATGQAAYGMAAVGPGKSTAGSKLIVGAVDKSDERPVWIAGWSGMSTLAQALTDVRGARAQAEVDAFVAKLRVYAISDQDDAGAWLRKEFPQLFYVVSPSDQTSDDYHLATWSGISGDEHYGNGPGYQLDLVSNAWLEANVRNGHGALGQLYPAWKYIMEGDTPSFLGLVDNGLGSSTLPSYGGWGGRYALGKPSGETREIWTNASDTFEYAAGSTNASNQATIWRWRPDFQYDFAARMDWCTADSFAKANHNPLPALDGDASKRVMRVSARAGDTIELSAEGTSDPDGDNVSIRWWLYPEAGTLDKAAKLGAGTGPTTQLALPTATTGTLHVILDVRDDGSPQLSAYRRAIIDVSP
jgi:hypothetical protein